MNNNIHLSLDEAREELKKRWENVELRHAIEAELGENFMPQFADCQLGISFRQVCSPDNGFMFFYQCSKYINVKPTILEYHDDMFVHFNEEKKGLGRLRVTLENGEKSTVDIMNFHENEKKPLGECVLKSGEKLVDFHHNLFEVTKYKPDFIENSAWFHKIGHASEYYYYLLLHFVAHGVLFETLDEGDEKELGFSDNIMAPAILKIKEKYGINPMITKSYPTNQNDVEDFYWWSYPQETNDFIVDYAKNEGLLFKKI